MSIIDVDKILEHQLNANILSMPYDVYSELFDSVSALGDENAKLRKENAELRVDVDLMNCQLRARAEERNDLQAENSKLRKLLREMYTVMVTDAANCDVTYPEQFDNRMRELGVEVSE